MGAGTQNATYQVTDQVVIGSGPTVVPVTALDAGTVGNLNPEDSLAFLVPPPGVDGTATVITMDGGVDTETDDELRARILRRIQQPPMGGDKTDYEAWALAVPGVTRAWASPQEMGIGTMTIRFLMDDLRAYNDGWPQADDITTVADYIDKMRPVTVKDCYVEAPIKQFLDITISNLVPDSVETRAEIEQSVQNMLFIKAAPAQTIYAAWINYAIMSAPSVISFKLVSDSDVVMNSLGNMAVLDTILYQ